MENKVLRFPKEYSDIRYAPVHYEFFIKYAEMAGFEVNKVEKSLNRTFGDDIVYTDGNLGFACCINKKQFYVNISDQYTHESQSFYMKNFPNILYFKYQKSEILNDNSIALGPPICFNSFSNHQNMNNIEEYFKLRDSFIFSPANKVLCKQRPYGGALNRRKKVQSIIMRNFKDYDINFSQINQVGFWKTSQNCLTSVCVPGHRNNMVDRGHMELLGLGVCTISPNLDTIFCYNKMLEPDVHYIRCKDDYSDLTEKIEMIQKDKKLCKQVGDNARDFFDSYYKPEKYFQWIESCL